MVRITNLILPPEGDPELLKRRAAKALGVSVGRLRSCTPVRQSIDARKKERSEEHTSELQSLSC